MVLVKQDKLLIIQWVTNAFNVSNTSLSGGTDDYAATNAEIATAYEKFNDTENVDISLLLCGLSQTGVDATGDTNNCCYGYRNCKKKIV